MIQSEIIGLFCDELNRELTINQMAILLKKSYFFTNTHVHQLITKQVLNSKVIGRAILCSLNFQSEEAVGLLVLRSIMKTQDYLKALSAKKRDSINDVINACPQDCIILAGSEIFIVSRQARARQTKRLKVRAICWKDIAPLVRGVSLKSIKVLSQHEQFWRSVR